MMQSGEQRSAVGRLTLSLSAPRRFVLGSGLAKSFQRPLQVVSLLIVLYFGFSSLLAESQPTAIGIDQVVYESTLAKMRVGSGYYPAMTEALSEVYGPPVAVRDFRLPTLFWVLRLLPPDALWPTFVLMAMCAGLVAVWASPGGLAGPLVSGYLLLLGRPSMPIGISEQFLTIELWTTPSVLACVALLFRRRLGPAATFAFLAFATREHAALLLIPVLVDCWFHGRRSVAVSGSLGAGILGTAHIISAARFTNPGGTHTPLDAGHEPARAFLEMVGFGISPEWLGLGLWLLAWYVIGRFRHVGTIGPYLALPLVGLFINRPYWGILIVPLSLLLAVAAVPDLFARWQLPVRRRLVGR